MNKRTFIKGIGLLVASPWFDARGDEAKVVADKSLTWALNMTVLESCSCPVFCPCFFDSAVPETSSTRQGHTVKEHACRFNQTFSINRGHSGSVRLDGVRFWYSGNGGDLEQPKNEWAVLTFDSGVTRDQREALLPLLQKHRWFRPASWKSYVIGDDAPIQFSLDDKGAHASLGGGALAETRTSILFGLHKKPVTITNLGYFGFTRNDGFVLMPSEVLAWRRGEDAFEFKKTNGLLTTVDTDSSDERT